MSIKASANYSQLIINNSGREGANPPIVFPDVRPNVNFSYSIWVKTGYGIPITLAGHNCIDGSFMRIANDGVTWWFESRNGAVALPRLNIGAVVPDRWTLYCVIKNGPTVIIYRGVEDPLDTNPWERPVELIGQNTADYSINAAFQSFVVVLYNSSNVCCFKFWNQALTVAEIQTQAQRWDTVGTPAPFWASPLRTAGDISNIANPFFFGPWDQGHAFIVDQPGVILSSGTYGNIITAGNLGGWNDPAYMANNQPCPTWVYPIIENSNCFIDPGMTPLIPTTYKAPQFFMMQDRGSIPHADGTIQSIKYWGFPISGPDAGTGPSDTWALYKDENGVEIAGNVGLPQYRFEGNTTGITVPAGLTANTMYLWKFGAQFTWQPRTPQDQTATGNLTYLFLYVTYIGFPSGFPLLSEIDLSGLFILNKPLQTRVDMYNNAVNLKIPDPVVKTAYIGE